MGPRCMGISRSVWVVSMFVHALNVVNSVSGKGSSAIVCCMGADLEGAPEGFGQGGGQRARATNSNRRVVNNGLPSEGSRSPSLARARTARWAFVAGIRFVAWDRSRRISW